LQRRCGRDRYDVPVVGQPRADHAAGAGDRRTDHRRLHRLPPLQGAVGARRSADRADAPRATKGASVSGAWTRLNRVVAVAATLVLVASCDSMRFGQPEPASDQGEHTLTLWRVFIVAG